MSEAQVIQYGPNCFDAGYYLRGDRGGFKPGMIDYHSEVQQKELQKKFDLIEASSTGYRSILFVGCASGNEPRYFCEQGKYATGCDISEYAIGSSDPSIRDRVRVFDGQHLNWLGDVREGVVASFDVLTIVPRDHREILAEEIIRVARHAIVIRVSVKPYGDKSDRAYDGIDGAPFKLEPLAYWQDLFMVDGKFKDFHANVVHHSDDRVEAVLTFFRNHHGT